MGETYLAKGPQCTSPSSGNISNIVNTMVGSLLYAQCSLTQFTDWPEDYGDKALKNGLKAHHFVVVGAGTAGSVMASRLSENPLWSVLLLEAGSDPPQESEVPGTWFSLLNSKWSWNYTTIPSKNTGLAIKKQISNWPRGKALGGTHAINAMLHTRGNEYDFDGWPRNEFYWTWRYINTIYSKALNGARNNASTTVSPFEVYDEDVRKMINEGAKELGEDKGYSNLPGTLYKNTRSSTYKSYLTRIGKRSNLHVIKNAHVKRINFDNSGKRVKSVQFILRDKHELSVDIAKELVLSAGTIESAKLLLLSGVGPKKHLDALKIPVRHALNVGESLQDHVMVPIFVKLKESTALNYTLLDLDSTYDYLSRYRDPLATVGPLGTVGTLSLVGYIKTGNDSARDIGQYHYIFRRSDGWGLETWLSKVGISDPYGESIRAILKTADLLIIFVLLAYPKSMGSVRLQSSNYIDAPLINPNYLNNTDDVDTLLRGIRYVEKITQTKSFKQQEANLEHIPIKECDNFEFKSDKYWNCYMRYFTLTAYDSAGTVKMGQTVDPNACVDYKLRLIGVDNLRVADASIMPEIPGGNINFPTTMVAEMASDFIKELNNIETYT